jgi:UDP-N-acetyl-D-galactosamine dehydrogenase
MGNYVAEQTIKLMMKNKIQVCGSRVLILGLTFKENCPDLRNTRIIDVVRELQGYNMLVDVHDPWVDPEEAVAEYGLKLVTEPARGAYDAVIIGVAHDQFRDAVKYDLRGFCKPDGVLYDVKYLLPVDAVDGRL